MIFVTVGTHEQPFNRLLEKIDELKKEGKIQDDVFIQSGYSTYRPTYCASQPILSYEEMQEKFKEANIVITHGGPATFMQVIQFGKIPIVVPRQAKYHEHVNDHQLDFCQKVVKRGYCLEIVEQIDELENALQRVDGQTQMSSRNEEFNRLFAHYVSKLEK